MLQRVNWDFCFESAAGLSKCLFSFSSSSINFETLNLNKEKSNLYIYIERDQKISLLGAL